MSKSYDLSTSTKWANLADGEHTVKIKAKGAGYGTSSFSNSVTVTKGTTGETWVLKDEINSYSGATTGGLRPGVDYLSIKFVTNGYNVKSLIIDSMGSYTSTGGWGIGIQSTASPSSASDTIYMYENGGGWTNTAFKTWVFSTPPTGDLLTWLQANGTKQGGVTEHTLTSKTIASHNIKVNGSALSALPYTLNNGDTIVVTLTGMEDSAISLNGVTRSNDDVVTVKDTDIAVELVDGSYNDPKLTINYTA